MDTDKQALLNYILGGSLQQEKPASHVIRQGQTAYAQGNTKTVPIPTHEEIEAQRRKVAVKSSRDAMPQSFTPMNWSQLGAPPQQKTTVKTTADAKEVKSPLWEHVKTK